MVSWLLLANILIIPRSYDHGRYGNWEVIPERLLMMILMTLIKMIKMILMMILIMHTFVRKLVAISDSWYLANGCH